MDGGYFHIRKDGIVATDRDLVLLKCNNGCKDCKWRGQMRTTDRTMTMEQPKFFDPESYIMVNYEKACQHSPDCIQEIVSCRYFAFNSNDTNRLFTTREHKLGC